MMAVLIVTGLKKGGFSPPESSLDETLEMLTQQNVRNSNFLLDVARNKTSTKPPSSHPLII
jgi:hypothetical protein